MRSRLPSCPRLLVSHWRSRVASRFPLQVRGRTQYRSLNARGLAEPSDHASTRQRKGNGDTLLISSTPQSSSPLTCPPSASPASSLSPRPAPQPICPPKTPASHDKPPMAPSHPRTTAPEAPLRLRRTTTSAPCRPFPAIVAPFPSQVSWGAGGRADGAGAGGGLRGSSPGEAVAALRCSSKGCRRGSSPSPPHSSGTQLKRDFPLCRQTTRLFGSLFSPLLGFFSFSWHTVPLAHPI